MTHYYFDLKNGITKRDHSGLELDNDIQAIAQGQSIAEEIGGIPQHQTCRVCIVREDGQEVMQVEVAADPDQDLAPKLKKRS
ncbi:hypothetical protein [Tardiphaga sp.]|uniref:DUF6894 family protein n=1 Tax=Tardiphaga sp. TaxID=1926292 RepID=UPI002635311A|nr:hypothetical protein [Tardiphaga sp.]MDB5620992.1 hypothetical protein [Tardiphaga sp.]